MSNELSTTNSYIAPQGFSLANALSEEMAGMDVRFDRIKMPIGGISVFEVPGEAPGETDAVKEFRGVILHHHRCSPTTAKATREATTYRTAGVTTV